jgi:N-acetylglutamate synthase
VDPIMELERIAAAHWRGTEEAWLGDWLLRAAEGFTGRANSVLPLGDPGVPFDDALDVVTDWYRARGLRPMIQVSLPLDDRHTHDLDHYLDERSWSSRSGPAFVMVAGLPLSGARAEALPPGAEIAVLDEPDDAWQAMYHYRGQDHLPGVAYSVLSSADEQSFIKIVAGDEILAIARVSIADQWAGLTAVEVNPAHRRQGLGTAVTTAACAEAARRGITKSFLQVEVTNAPARALYESLGFRYTHHYHYRVAPA